MQCYNSILDVSDISDSSGTGEPVSLTEIKNYLRLQGFVNTDNVDSGFSDDDDLIEQLIVSARARSELYTGSSIVNHKWKVIATNLAGMLKLPFGPGVSITSVTDSDGNALSNPKLQGDYLVSPCNEAMIVQYTAGYSVVPAGIKEAIMKEVCYRYEHRGDELDDEGICKAAIVLLNPYKRASWLE